MGISTVVLEISLGTKMILIVKVAPLACFLGPIVEECVLRGNLQEKLTDKFNSFYAKGLSEFKCEYLLLA